MNDDIIFEAHVSLVFAIFRRAVLDAQHGKAEARDWLLRDDDGMMKSRLKAKRE